MSGLERFFGIFLTLLGAEAPAAWASPTMRCRSITGETTIVVNLNCLYEASQCAPAPMGAGLAQGGDRVTKNSY